MRGRTRVAFSLTFRLDCYPLSRFSVPSSPNTPVGLTPSPINVASVLVVKEEVALELSLFDFADVATVRGGLHERSFYWAFI